MPEDYKVEKNDTLSIIAKKKGSLIDSLIKANLKKWPYLAKHPNVLAEGMTITIPDKTTKKVSLSTGSEQNYIKKKDKELYLRLTLEDPNNSIDKTKISLTRNSSPVGIDIVQIEATPNNSGWKIIKTKAPITDILSGNWALEFTKIILGNASNQKNEKIILYIGELDPIMDPTDNDISKVTDHAAPKKAVQKILTNLGYYNGDINGKWDQKTESAIARFQNEWMNPEQVINQGQVDTLTSIYLACMQQNEIGISQTIKNSNSQNDRNLPLLSRDGYVPTRHDNGDVGTLYNYREHTNHNPLTGRPKSIHASNKIRSYPNKAYVAPCFEEPTEQYCSNPNPIRSPANKFIFLDSGRWYKDARDFGVIWGRHVYLCNYNTSMGGGKFFESAQALRKEGLDYKFFSGMKKTQEDQSYSSGIIKIVSWETAEWGTEDEYEWDKIYIIIPDLHLMNYKIGNIWHEQQFKLKTEVDLLRFCLELRDVLKRGEVRIIQIGDCYDLWVGYGFVSENLAREYDNILDLERNYPKSDLPKRESMLLMPLFEENETGTMELLENKTICKVNYSIPDPAPFYDTFKKTTISTHKELCKYISDIQGISDLWVTDELLNRTQFHRLRFKPASEINSLCKVNDNWINPAEAALRLLEDAFGEDFIYIYGNHDNYLIDPILTKHAKIKNRKAFHEHKSLYIEHAHRMEDRDKTGGVNYDGAMDGFRMTNILFRIRNHEDPTDILVKMEVKTGNEFADFYAGEFQQPIYINEFSKLWLGRRSTRNLHPPHIFVIGHTHMPILSKVSIRCWPHGVINELEKLEGK